MTEGPVIFDQEITNIGNGYSTNTGMFTVPANGLYAFSWTTETHGELTETSLVANGVSRGSAIAHEIESHYDTTTSFAILELQANDIVYVNVTQGRAQGERTMFSGWKINDKGKSKLSRAKTYKNHKATPSIPNLFSELVYFFLFLKDRIPAFYSSLSAISNTNNIVYDNVYQNEMSGYTPSTGRFVAPTDGLYAFMTSSTIYGNRAFPSEFRFRHDSAPSIYLDGTTGLHDSSGYITFAWLKANDYVYIHAGTLEPSSMFAGWMVLNSTHGKHSVNRHINRKDVKCRIHVLHVLFDFFQIFLPIQYF